MCWNWFKNLGKVKPTPTVPAQPTLLLPHPEEPRNDAQTMANSDVQATLTRWMADWGVPSEWDAYWRSQIVISLKDDIPYPAGTYGQDGKRFLNVRPEWLNPGVIAHEQAHNSYALLSETDRIAFGQLHGSLKSTDPLMKLLYSKNTYGLSSDVEGHAEVYRYIGQQMPIELKKYYPRLIA
jgi:hypothetical protein